MKCLNVSNQQNQVMMGLKDEGDYLCIHEGDSKAANYLRIK